MKNYSHDYDYQSVWGQHAFPIEDNRFLCAEPNDLLKICDCIDINDKTRKKVFGGVPIHYEDGKLYCLKEGPHVRVEGESGSKKSRTICRGSAISATLNGDSFIMTDPKGEISSDPKIQSLLREHGMRVHVLDFRTFSKDGFNPFSHAFNLYKDGKVAKAMATIDRFTNLLYSSTSATDKFWDRQGSDLIRASLQMLLCATAQLKDGEKLFNIASLKSFLRQDISRIRLIASRLVNNSKGNALSAQSVYSDITSTPEKTYSCIVSSANALLSSFASAEESIRMMSNQTFDVRSFYTQPSALFLVIPDSESTYDELAGYQIDLMYQTLVETYDSEYLNRKVPPCNVHFICDEVANVRVNQMASKISASRSRQIDWILLFQSEKQMETAYPKEWGTIKGNCKHKIWLGSSDHDILTNISAQVGTTSITYSKSTAPLVSVDDLRRMRKEWTYKDALILTGNYILTVKLPDYDVFPFLQDNGYVDWPSNVLMQQLSIYTPEDLVGDVCASKVDLDYDPSMYV